MKTNKIIMAAAAAAALVLLAGCGRTKIDLNNYLTLEPSGFDTAGKVSTSFDYDALVSDNLKAFGLSDNAGEEEELGVMMRIEEYISGDLDKDTGLSNGDTVTYTWDVNEARLEELFPVDIVCENKTLDITGLEEGEKFDPFENIKVTFSGVAPNGDVSISDSDSEVSGLLYLPDKIGGLSNGDKVVVTVSAPSGELDDYCRGYGKIPTATEKEYTVEGLSAYAMKLDDIPQDTLDKMDKNAQDSLKAYTAANWVEPESFKGMKLLGNYFVYPKDSSISVSPTNYVYFVYEVTALNADDNNKPFNYYYYSYYTDVMLLEDGTCSFDLSSMGVPEGNEFYGETFSTGKYYYKGYRDLDSLFNKQITAKIDKYAYENTVKQ